MNQKLRLFSKQLLIMATITGMAIIAAMLVIPPSFISPALPYLLVFFTAATLISFYFLQKKIESTPSGFVTAFMANSIIRLLGYLIVIVVYAFTNKPDAVNFIISFFILYVIFTAFEVTFFLRK
ncbi:MAG: hypothetical protein H6541_11610 [Lentimicrobiaceae bacterium]|nr:hypothetical protein [Lentimicrobiaceae bacterium]MCO5264457.1 hypothetical protein [Lentimicrobium sp.]